MNVQTPVIASGADASATAPPLDRSNILIVDDRLDKRVVFRTILEELDQNIVTASSGEEALRWLLDNECAVILLDVNMPGMDGLETAELIRARRKSSHTPIIFITAFADEMHTARGYSLGAVDYILSPVVPNVLRSKVKALVQLHRLNHELRRRADERVALAREQAARTAAEDAERRSSFLAEATHAIGGSLDVDTILRSASGLVVPFLADHAVVVLAGDDGTPRARRHASVAGWEGHLAGHQAAFESMIEAQLQLALSSRSHIASDRLFPAEGVGAGAPAGELHAFPLITRGKSRGVLMLALGPSPRRLSAADLLLADSLAGRVAGALENCLLYEEIQKADQRKNEFLATLSHELRNPLAPMRAALHMLRAGPVEESRSRSLLETMDRQVAQMSRLVEDLLDISRITRGAIELRRENIDVAAEVRHAIESCDGALKHGAHKVEVVLPERPLRVHADRVRLQQILENLILNAAKYTPAGGRIEVGAREEDNQAVIHVSDNGIGIASDKLQQVWELFVQVDESTERTRKGLGIGLALVQDLVHRHGGTVEAASGGLGQGSTFTVRLPKLEADGGTGDPGPAAAARPKPQAEAGRRILIVDDNVDAAETLAMMLEILGQETRQAHDGQQAIDVAREYRPDVVFMDIGLPGLSGHQAAAKMREELGMKDTYLIALSGYGTEEDRRKSIQAGFDTHLVKPLDPSCLPELLAGGRRAG